ncbi:MAG TPA: alcohol dehydrogenase catalytic domain-containing protein [Nocardioidaceae bacterium]|nr:alcohol dehydrogenase catalytic domain-containing protein [Nocardioidaceae bacterium]
MRYVEITPGQVTLREGPPAALQPGDARVRVLACGVCGTDLEALRGMVLPRGVDYPLRPGHEIAGVVTEAGPALDGTGTTPPDTPAVGTPAAGEMVVLHPLAPCGTCEACRRGEEQLCSDVRALGFHTPGGLAEEVVWPAARMVPVRGLPPAQAALLADAVATAFHALTYAEVPAGGVLCVLGAGGLGGQVIRLARVLHPDVTVVAVVRSQATADRVAQLGGVAIRGLEGALRGVRDAVGRPDAVIDFTGDETAAGVGLRLLRPGGRLVLGSVVDKPIDLGISVTGITSREIAVRGAYVSTMDELRAVTELACAGRLDLGDAVSHVLPLERAPEALEIVEAHPPGLQRLVITPGRQA